MWVSVSTFTCSHIGSNDVTLYVRDSSGNVESDVTQVTVTDTLSPVVVTHSLTVCLDTMGTASIAPADINAGSYDNCGIDSFWLDKELFNCSDLGVQTVTLFARDSSGNMSFETAEVAVVDTVKPVVRTQSIIVYLDDSGVSTVSAAIVNNGSADNCAVDSLWLDRTSFDCSHLGNNTVTLSVRDSSGNIGTATAAVMVVDTVKPVVHTRDFSVFLDASGVATINVNDVNDGSSDACGVIVPGWISLPLIAAI
jgi:hypothetical protein